MFRLLVLLFVNHYEVHVMFHDIEHQLWENTSLSSLQFLTKSSLNLEVSLIHSKLFTGSFCNIAQPHKLFTSQYLRYDDSLFLSEAFLYLLLAFVYWWTAWYV